MLVMAGKPVDATIELLLEYLEEGDCIIDGGNEWCAVLFEALHGCWRKCTRLASPFCFFAVLLV